MIYRMIFILNWVSIACYSTALVLLWQYTTLSKKHTDTRRATIMIICIIGLCLHAVGLVLSVNHYQALNPNLATGATFSLAHSFSLGHSISLVTLMALLVFILLSMVRKTLNLGLAILPPALLAVFAGRWLNSEEQTINVSLASFEWHIALGVITFSLLSLAFAQSIFIVVLENQLKSPQPSRKRPAIISLPALQSMEALLFQLLWLGFMVLSLTLFIGLFLNQDIQGAALSFTHHIILTIITWLAYAILLLGRHFMGWRGRHAAIYTIICFVLFLLGYFGSRVVRELIIN